MAQRKAPKIRTTATARLTLLAPRFCTPPTRRATPTKPSASPPTTVTVGLVLFHAQSRRAIQRGTVATSNDVRPEEVVCSAQTTAPFPPRSMNPPTMNAFFHCCLVGRLGRLRLVRR